MSYSSDRMRQLLGVGFPTKLALKIATDETANIAGVLDDIANAANKAASSAPGIYSTVQSYLPSSGPGTTAAPPAPRPLNIQRIGLLETVQMPDGTFLSIDALRTHANGGDPVALGLYNRYTVIKAGGVDPIFLTSPTPGAPPVLIPGAMTFKLPSTPSDVQWPLEVGAA